ncbi:MULTISPECIES: tRNA1(Val) (adenine(37)-N6)-methyltransferase [unclassified Leisingera]|uniref:tRNA1(Val) (adenine(37)-N6)-methyltransferase n=1 Tax=unclassified Leisingera TaxID=2614906 RepID=UPI00031C0F31|nr:MULTISPECIES: methyltransferase [unclassified Leisingera]KIC24593.1 methyltransferase [Leisingera sp. ANG-S3]KIC55551.1 methyltransferase [Leisingera sp. ANG-S]KID09283.1 methyltransferase [Leisingera sp. ANG1]
MTVFPEDELTRNGFLGGRVQLWQPARGYRAGVDPVLLAAAAPARGGEAVLELGCGAGQALLCLGYRVPGLSLAGVELQAPYADLARRNAQANGQDIDVFEADLSALPEALKQRQFHHVIANPPYYKAGAHSQAHDDGRKLALGEGTPLADWITAAARRLAPKGYLHMIQRADRLPDMLAGCSGVLGSIEVLPLAPRQARAAELVILRARKGGRADFRLHAPLILHQGTRHDRDGDSYRAEISAILRDGAALPWPA